MNLPQSLRKTGIAAATVFFAAAICAADDSTPPPHALPATVSASVTAGSPAPAIPTGAAAVIDGHEIPMADVIAACLRSGGPSVVDNMVNDYLIDRECTRRNVVVPPSAIDARVEELRKRIAPTTLEEGLATHHQTLPMLQAEFKKIIQREMLVESQVKPTKMANCRAIYIGYAPKGMPVAPGTKIRTQAEALALATKIQGQIIGGKNFSALATQYSEDSAKASAGNIGVVFDGINDVDTAMIHAALSQKPGITSEPIPTYNGYYLVQVISTSDSHPVTEDALYQNADRSYKQQQAQFLIGPLLAGLRRESKVTYNLPQ